MLQRRTWLKVCDGTTSEEKGPSEDSCNRAVLEQWRLAKQRSNAMRTGMVTYEGLEAQEASRGVNGSGVSLSISVVAPVNSPSTISSTATMEKGNLTTVNENIQGCSYGIGKWILDDNQPQCSSFGCKKWLSTMWACRLTQRTDFTYEKLRWQPKNCEMENFTGSKFLRRSQEAQI